MNTLKNHIKIKYIEEIIYDTTVKKKKKKKRVDGIP